MNVPTGGGKTLASLRFALAHAAANKKSRVIFTSPLLSILDQNAQVLRDYIGDDSLILEHHSNVVRQSPEAGPDELDPRELLAENWNAPIIITTLVQLLNTLFDGRTTCIRRFQALCNCVLVIDEAQNLTPKQAKGIITRAGMGTKIILLGDPQQIDHPLLDERTNGLSYAAEKMKGSPLCWQVTMSAEECERSALAMDAVKRM